MTKLLLPLLFIYSCAMSQTIPSSTRSITAINKVTPQLTVEFKESQLTFGAPIFIRIFKQEAILEIWVKNQNHFTLFKTYPICNFGFAGLGPKLKEGDGKAPEGFYFVKASQLNPYSSYHLSFNLGYPNTYDRAHKRTGSALMVHGDCVSVGCYAMTNNKIEEIFTIAHAALSSGQSFFRVHVFPFKMTDENLTKYKGSQWFNFWKNLKQGYDYFEANNFNPPNVTVEDLKYYYD